MRNESRPAPSVRAGFTGFGPSRFLLAPSTLKRIEVASDLKETRRQIHDLAPKQSGVYGMLDRHQRLIYIGMSGQLRSRLLSYFYDTAATERNRFIASHAMQVVWEAGPHEFIALLREFELIRRFRPRFNVRGQPGHRRGGYLYLTSSEAPHFLIDRLPARGARHCWGPLPMNQRSRWAVEQLNHLFKLRDCPRKVAMHFPEQRTLFPQQWPAQCERAEFETCLAPCTGLCTREQYESRLVAARRMLDEGDARELNDLIKLCELAAQHGHDSHAAALYQTWEELLQLCEQVRLARDVKRNYQFIYAPPCHSDNELWIPIQSGEVSSVIEAPQTVESAQQCSGLVERMFGHQAGFRAIDDLELIRIVVSWFRRHPEQMAHTLTPAAAQDLCMQWMPAAA